MGGKDDPNATHVREMNASTQIEVCEPGKMVSNWFPRGDISRCRTTWGVVARAVWKSQVATALESVSLEHADGIDLTEEASSERDRIAFCLKVESKLRSRGSHEAIKPIVIDEEPASSGVSEYSDGGRYGLSDF